MHKRLVLGPAIILFAGVCVAQTIELREAAPVSLPALVDSNTPVFWRDGRFHFFSSSGDPILNSGPDMYHLTESSKVELGPGAGTPMWIEAVWQDADGTLFMWYHHEQVGLCGSAGLSVPQIGAAVSYDGGRSLVDLGIVMEAGYPADCGAKNGFFAGGHGDFSVVLNPQDGYFYFYFSNYSGPASEQGVAVARMQADRRHSPAGAVYKYRDGGWEEPGLGGLVTPIFPAVVAWGNEDAEAFWGPSVHWNTSLDRFVMLLNRSCCTSGWPQDGVWIATNPDPGEAAAWTAPQKLIGAGEWYPQVIGVGLGETDSIAGANPRLFVRGFSDWEIVFKPAETAGAETTGAADVADKRRGGRKGKAKRGR